MGCSVPAAGKEGLAFGQQHMELCSTPLHQSANKLLCPMAYLMRWAVLMQI